ncbi:MAG: hypothetical protein A4E36_00774 [Methanoregulaceae archaeon PtaB.Bin009]|nr:MAG: hypothetical protein A4E36_00774 [Methanoregulaceae archaeon PtaB.Bin009]OPY39469.1 MAG: hypothetical protein A4E41_01703 [Methanoregulaceae archaeon PtaU1.Bin066]
MRVAVTVVGLPAEMVTSLSYGAYPSFSRTRACTPGSMPEIVLGVEPFDTPSRMMVAPEGIEDTLRNPVETGVLVGLGPGPPWLTWTTKTEIGWTPDIPGGVSGQRFTDACPETNVRVTPDPSAGSVQITSSPGRSVTASISRPSREMVTFVDCATHTAPAHSPQSGCVKTARLYLDARGARRMPRSPKRRVAWRGSEEYEGVRTPMPTHRSPCDPMLPASTDDPILT